MNFFSLLSLITSGVGFFFGNFILYQNPKSILNRMFFTSSMVLSYWSFAEFGCRQAETYESAYFWLKIVSLWPFFLAFIIHFILAFTEKGTLLKKRITYVCLYAPALILSVILMMTNQGTVNVVKTYWGWTYRIPTDSGLYKLILIWSVGLSTILLILCVDYYKKTTDQNKKKQTIYIFIGYFFAVFLGLLTEVILPFQDIRVPEMTTTGFVFGTLFFGYALWKYNLFALTPATAAENILAMMPDAVFLVNKNGKILSANNAALSLLEYREPELVDKSVELLFEKKEIWMEELSANGAIRDITTILTTKSDEKIPVSLSASVMNKKTEFGYIYICRDITEHIKAYEILKESEDKLKLIFENANDSIVYVDLDGSIINVNSKTEEIFGYNREEVIGKKFPEFDFFKPKDMEEGIELVKDIISGKDLPIMEFKILTKEKRPVFIEVNSRLIKKDHEIKGILNIIRDVTLRKSTEEEKRQLEARLFRFQKIEALGTMAGGIAHDFSNSLGSIILNAEMALEELEENAEAKYSLEQVLKSSHHARKLVRQILTFSRNERIDREPLKLDGIIKETVEMIQAMLPKTISIEQNISDISGGVLANPIQIQQLVMNLCTNAAHAVKQKKGKLIISLQRIVLNQSDNGIGLDAGEYACLNIQDNGHGIPNEIMDKIFDPFYTTKRPGEGTGLGLSVVHGIVENHKGKITVQSQPGIGTRFQIYFPLIAKSVETNDDKDLKSLVDYEKIILFDDDEILGDAGQKVLEHLGHKVVVEKTTEDAFELLKGQIGPLWC